MEVLGGAKVSWVPYLSYTAFLRVEKLVRETLSTKDPGAALASVVMAVACSEAYVNETGYMELNKKPDKHNEFKDMGTDLVRKYRHLANLKGASYEEDREPLASFRLLIGLRGLLVHYEVKEEPLELEESRIEKRLAEHFSMRRADVWIDRVLGGACANWALDTIFRMMRHLYDSGYEPPNVAWFEAFRPGIMARMSTPGPSGVRRLRDL